MSSDFQEALDATIWNQNTKMYLAKKDTREYKSHGKRKARGQKLDWKQYNAPQSAMNFICLGKNLGTTSSPNYWPQLILTKIYFIYYDIYDLDLNLSTHDIKYKKKSWFSLLIFCSLILIFLLKSNEFVHMSIICFLNNFNLTLFVSSSFLAFSFV